MSTLSFVDLQITEVMEGGQAVNDPGVFIGCRLIKVKNVDAGGRQRERVDPDTRVSPFEPPPSLLLVIAIALPA